MDDLFTALDPSKVVKTYTKADRTGKKPKDNHKIPISEVQTPLNDIKRDPLTTKNALTFLLEGTLKNKVCRYCLNVSSELSELDQILQIADKETLYRVTIKDMVASFHPFKIAEDPNFPDKICDKCIDRTLTSYLFTQQCERAERALRNCFDDMYKKLDKLDPLDPPKKRGRQKLNPNYNTLYAEHNKVIDYANPIIHIVNTASEQLTEQSPIRELECLKCCELLPNLESLLNHTKMHPSSMWYNCRLCGQSFVKVHHLKKHFRTKHQFQTPPTALEVGKNYDCKTCGVVKESYSQFLQHMQKHKFKMVMEHLVEGKMDKLCTVCMDKGINMVGMDEMICLHGGCPELTGYKSLYNVLANTLPENMNKYQELLVPTQATIIKVVKRKIRNPSETKSPYKFSKPHISTVEEINENHDDYMFFFSEPHKVNKTKLMKVNTNNDDDIPDVEEIKMEKCDLTSVTDNEMPIVATTVELDGAKTITIVSDDSIDTHAVKNNSRKTSDQLERFPITKPDYNEIGKSWIFNDIGNHSDTEIKSDAISNATMLKNDESIESQSCDYCWVFKNLAKCEYCNKSKESLISIVKIDIPDSSQHVDDKVSDVYIDNNKNQISSIVSDINKTTWQCDICLFRNNINRETCFCCEAKPISDVAKDFKFHKTNVNFDLTKAERPKIKTDVENKIIYFTPNAFDTKPQFTEINNNKDYTIIANIDTQDMSIMMETETIEEKVERPTNMIEDLISKQEAMDIEECDMPPYVMPTDNTNKILNTHMSHQIANIVNPTINTNNLGLNPFQFTIGSGSMPVENAPRKYKRAARNRAFHK